MFHFCVALTTDKISKTVEVVKNAFPHSKYFQDPIMIFEIWSRSICSVDVSK